MIEGWTNEQIRTELSRSAPFDRVVKNGRSLKVSLHLSPDGSHLWLSGRTEMRINLREVDSILLGQKSKVCFFLSLFELFNS
jgi:hypothetical protein